MMNKKSFRGIWAVAAVAGIVLVSQVNDAFAWGRPSRDKPFPHRNRSVSRLPHGHISIALGGLNFFYKNGIFYRRSAVNYVAVTPPYGVVIAALPAGYQGLLISGNTYYYYGGTYYKPCPSGYMVVPDPVVYAPQTVIVEPPAATIVSQKVPGTAITVNIPNSNGSYTPVVLQRSGSGYLGPQGEYYSDNPTIEQLKALYGK